MATGGISDGAIAAIIIILLIIAAAVIGGIILLVYFIWTGIYIIGINSVYNNNIIHVMVR